MWRGDANLPHTASVELPQFVPLTALYVGRHASTNHGVLFLWVSGFGPSEGAPKRLVLVAVQDKAKPQPAKTLRCWSMKNSPFFAPQSGLEGKLPFRGVCTFEMDLSDIVGLDYINPLLVDASRLVIEARKITRRWFPTLDRCSDHYGWGDFQRRKRDDGSEAPVVRLLSQLYQPQSNLGGRPNLPHVVPQSEFCRAPSSSKRDKQPAYWRERCEEQRYEMINRVFLVAERIVRRMSWHSVDEGAPKDEKDDDCMVEEVIRNETINFRFDDPFLPYVLREVIHDPDHPELLRLYEAGLPAWAILLPQYTGLYRRSMRIFISGILLLISCISMLLGFYDLYKRIPAVRALLKQVMGPMSSKLEELVVVRFSVLLAWLLPYDIIFRRCWHASAVLMVTCRQLSGDALQLVASGAAVVGAIVAPLASTLWFAVSTVCQPVGAIVVASRTMVRVFLDALCGVVSTCRGAVWTLTRIVGSLGATRVEPSQTTGALLRAEVTLVRQACMSIYNGTIFLGVKCAKHQASMRLSFWRWQVRWHLYICELVARRPLGTVAALALLILWLRSASIAQLAQESAVAYLPAAAKRPLLSVACTEWGYLAPLICGSAWQGSRAEPQVLEVKLMCATGVGEACWERFTGRRCRCPYEALQGLNVTMDRPGVVSVALAPRRHSNGSMNLQALCQGTGTGSGCIVKGLALQRVLHGGTAEVLVLLDAARGATAAAAAFVLEAPRQRAKPPGDVQLCLEAGDRPWSFLLPLCGGGPAVAVGLGAAALENVRGRPDTEGWGAGGHRGLAASQADGATGVRLGAVVRASWRPGKLGSCRLAAWEASIELPGEDCSSAILCRAGEHDHTTCIGVISPALEAPATRAAGGRRSERQHGRQSSSHASGGAVRAAVRVRCADPVDSPAEVARSPLYRPVETTQKLVQPVKWLSSLWYGLSLCLVTVEAWAPAWAWAQAWFSSAAPFMLREVG